MKLICSLLLFALFSASNTFAAVYEIKTMNEVPTYANVDTLVIFDLDNTVMSPAQTLGSEQWFDYLVKNYIEKGQQAPHAIELALQQYGPIQLVTKMVPTETDTPALLAQFARYGITTFALTSRSREISEVTFTQLKAVGVEFSIPFSAEQNIAAPKPAFFKNGVVFSGDNNKGDVLKLFLEQNGMMNKRIVFIDNKAKHVNNLEQTFAGHDYVGLRYSFADEWINSLNPCAVDYQWEQYSASGVLLSDQEATQHCAP